MPALSSNQLIEFVQYYMKLGMTEDQALAKTDEMMAAEQEREERAKKLKPEPKLPIAPTAMFAAKDSAAHLEDANASAWQKYSQMLDASTGTTAPKRRY